MAAPQPTPLSDIDHSGNATAATVAAPDTTTTTTTMAAAPAQPVARPFFPPPAIRPKKHCKVCDKIFSSSGGLSYHMRREHNPQTKGAMFPCPVRGCLKRFASKQGLHYHLNHHARKRPKSIPCPIAGCVKTFMTCAGRRYHMRYGTHEFADPNAPAAPARPAGDAEAAAMEDLEAALQDEDDDGGDLDEAAAPAPSRLDSRRESSVDQPALVPQMVRIPLPPKTTRDPTDISAILRPSAPINIAAFPALIKREPSPAALRPKPLAAAPQPVFSLESPLPQTLPSLESFFESSFPAPVSATAAMCGAASTLIDASPLSPLSAAAGTAGGVAWTDTTTLAVLRAFSFSGMETQPASAELLHSWSAPAYTGSSGATGLDDSDPPVVPSLDDAPTRPAALVAATPTAPVWNSLAFLNPAPMCKGDAEAVLATARVLRDLL